MCIYLEEKGIMYLEFWCCRFINVETLKFIILTNKTFSIFRITSLFNVIFTFQWCNNHSCSAHKGFYFKVNIYKIRLFCKEFVKLNAYFRQQFMSAALFPLAWCIFPNVLKYLFWVTQYLILHACHSSKFENTKLPNLKTHVSKTCQHFCLLIQILETKKHSLPN